MSMTDSRSLTTMADLHHTHIGRDAEGDWHHHDSESALVHVVSGDGERETHVVHADDIGKWVGFVDGVRGWDDLGYTYVSGEDLWGDSL